jgi:hypothetical protein
VTRGLIDRLPAVAALVLGAAKPEWHPDARLACPNAGLGLSDCGTRPA